MGSAGENYEDDTNNHCCGRKWCVTDACGITCSIFTWILLFYGQFCVCSIMMAAAPENLIHQSLNFIAFELFFIMALLSHIKTMLTNPGTVPKGTLTDEQVSRFMKTMSDQKEFSGVTHRCTKCACLKPERAHHCSVCKRCVRRMDHHCPWVNNCVGENNQKCFVLFTLYVALLSGQALYWAVWHFVLCVNQDWRQCSSFGAPATTVLLIILLFESILFSIFTAVMFGTQLSAICSDQTGIEALKHEAYGSDDRSAKRSWKNLQVVFGGPFSVQWFNPFALPFITEKAFEFSV